jgi:hypothetical protein
MQAMVHRAVRGLFKWYHSDMKGPGEERVKSIFIHFTFLLPSGALKCVLFNSINTIWKNELRPKI